MPELAMHPKVAYGWGDVDRERWDNVTHVPDSEKGSLGVEDVRSFAKKIAKVVNSGKSVLILDDAPTDAGGRCYARSLIELGWYPGPTVAHIDRHTQGQLLNQSSRTWLVGEGSAGV